MKKSYIYFFFLFVCIALGVSSCQMKKTESEVQLKVLSWNIWHAGHEKEYPGQGCESTIEILRACNADVILMIETYGAAPRIADSLGYHYELFSSNLCLFSRYPIIRKFTFPDTINTFNFGGAEINVKGRPVRLFDTWLHYLPDARLVPTEKSEAEILSWDDEGTRDDEIKKILSVIDPMLLEVDSIPIIMGGDFNSHSHLDWTAATANLYNHGGAVVNWTVSKAMEQAGFKDSFRELHPNPADTLGATWFSPADSTFPKRMDRIDFIYYKGAHIHAQDAQIQNADLATSLQFEGKEFFYPSDHGFVLTTFKIRVP